MAIKAKGHKGVLRMITCAESGKWGNKVLYEISHLSLVGLMLILDRGTICPKAWIKLKKRNSGCVQCSALVILFHFPV